MSVASIFHVRQENTVRITGQFVDESGEGFLPDTITVLLYEKTSGEVINSRDRQSLRNANGATCDAEGNFEWIMAPEDNVILGSSPEPATEKHIALLEWEWDTTKRADIEIEVRVKNTAYVPA